MKPSRQKKDRTLRLSERPLRLTLEEYERGALLRAALLSALQRLDPANTELEGDIADFVLAGEFVRG
jgi:hypothetical protein